MKVFIILTPAFNPNAGGVQRTTFKLGRYFTQQGLQVAYYSFADHGHAQAEFGQLYHAHETGSCQNRNNLRDMQQALRTERPDIVINQMPYEVEMREAVQRSKAELGFVSLACLRNSLFSFRNNAREISKRTIPRQLFWLVDNKAGMHLIQLYHRIRHTRHLKTILDLHDKFILLAPPNKMELEYWVGKYKEEKVLFIPNSIPDVHPSGQPRDKTILHVGRICIPQKRSDLLLDFWEKAQHRLPDWNFTVIGDGIYLEEMKEQVAARKLQRINLLGYQKPEEYFKKASIFVMASEYEGFPNVVLEAQSYGVVPVAFDSYPALSWIVNNGKDALLVPGFNTELMAQLTADLATDDARLKQYSKNALQNAGRFTIDTVGAQWMEFFKTLVSC